LGREGAGLRLGQLVDRSPSQGHTGFELASHPLPQVVTCTHTAHALDRFG
jgi:hypothetical protein